MYTLPALIDWWLWCSDRRRDGPQVYLQVGAVPQQWRRHTHFRLHAARHSGLLHTREQRPGLDQGTVPRLVVCGVFFFPFQSKVFLHCSFIFFVFLCSCFCYWYCCSFYIFIYIFWLKPAYRMLYISVFMGRSE